MRSVPPPGSHSSAGWQAIATPRTLTCREAARRRPAPRLHRPRLSHVAAADSRATSAPSRVAGLGEEPHGGLDAAVLVTARLEAELGEDGPDVGLDRLLRQVQ